MLKSLKRHIPKDKITWIVWLGMIGIAFFTGWMMSGDETIPNQIDQEHESEETGTNWTCSMHPQIQVHEF